MTQLFEIRVPDMGESVSSCIISKIFFREGDHVKSDETFAELETEKVNLVLACDASGIVNGIFCKDGDELGVGTLVATILPNYK